MGWGGCEGLIGSVFFTHLIINFWIDGSFCVEAWIWASSTRIGLFYDVGDEIMNASFSLGEKSFT